jgi:DnaJ-class molecular chaperone
MYRIICKRCYGIGVYERPCQCFADDDCSYCHGKGYFWKICLRCGGSGIVEIKMNKLNESIQLVKN